jgi:hypothetical protein
MSRIKFLQEQIERARRFAAGMTNADDRVRLEAAADNYQRELDALSSPDAKSADTSPPSDAVAEQTTPDTTEPSDAIRGDRRWKPEHVGRYWTARDGLTY